MIVAAKGRSRMVYLRHQWRLLHEERFPTLRCAFRSEELSMVGDIDNVSLNLQAEFDPEVELAPRGVFSRV